MRDHDIKSQREQERRYRRWVRARRLRRALPWVISAAMLAAFFLLARK